MKKRYSVVCALIALLITACALDGGNVIGPAGGIVFYDKGSYSDGWRYLEFAPEDAGTGSWEKAKQLCDDYSYGGYGDWSLPNLEDLKNLLDRHGSGMFANGVYWSSSEEDVSHAWGIQNGEPGQEGSSSGMVQDPAAYSKSSEYKARPVRQF
jgi:hypothetical protein